MPEENKDIIDTAHVAPLLARAVELQRASDGKREIVADQLREASNQLRVMEHGHHAAAPMRCAGATCPMRENCPLFRAGFTYMIGQQCPIERHLLAVWTENYMTTLQVDQNNVVEMNLVADLAKVDLFNMRVANRLAYQDFVTRQAVGVTDDGDVQYRDELSVAAQWEDMLTKRKLKLLDVLLATRKAIADAGAGSGTDPSTSVSRVRGILERKKRQLAADAERAAAEIAKNITPQD